jgi:hypothetical protein
MIKLTPSDPYDLRNLRKWFERTWRFTVTVTGASSEDMESTCAPAVRQEPSTCPVRAVRALLHALADSDGLL